MTAVEKALVSVDEYLAYEARAETKHEYVNGEIVAMAGASPEHSVVREALAAAVASALEAAGRPCIPFSSDTRVQISETGLYAYPDLAVVCGKAEFDRREMPPSLLNPRVIFEVLSESTEAHDRGAKAAHYRSRASLQEYVLVSSTERKVEVLRRSEPEGWWASAIFQGEAVVPLASLAIEISVPRIYRLLDQLHAAR